MIKERINKLLLISVLSLSFLFFSCSDGRNEGIDVIMKSPVQHKLDKVVFYLENSESMFGYVNGFTQYVDVVSELSQNPMFVGEKIKTEFYLINGGQLKINKLGYDPIVLKSKLNKVGFNVGNITKSNLNEMFQVALDKAQGDTISLLISDGIYDIGQPGAVNNLAIEGKGTRTKFINRLQSGGLETLLIKIVSKFDGLYFYSSKRGKVAMDQPRPFYIWIFGKSELLNKYFTEEYITQKLNGYQNYARFLSINEKSIPYQIAPSIKRKGSFRPDRSDKNRLTNAKPDRNGQGFQFSIAVDFSSLPFSENYLTSIANYSTSNINYKVVSVERIKDNQKFEITSFKNPTHIITVATSKSPYGDLEITLKNKIPGWIDDTNIDNENQIDGTHTFGFKFLTEAISQAYEFKNNGKNLATFKLEIK